MKELLQETADTLGISIDIVERVIKTYMNFIKFKISKVPYRNLYSFEGVKTNFNLPGLGKFVVKHKSVKRLQNEKRFKTIERKGNV